MTRDQLATVIASMTGDQLRAALRLVLDRNPRTARDVIDAAIAQHPILPPPREEP